MIYWLVKSTSNNIVIVASDVIVVYNDPIIVNIMGQVTCKGSSTVDNDVFNIRDTKKGLYIEV